MVIRGLFLLLACLLAALGGCAALWPTPAASPAVAQVQPNPIFIPLADREFVWNQVVDAVDDYFRIEREMRVQLVGDVLTEGRLDTIPTVGSTFFEPWGSDSSPGYERYLATFQSIRRRAVVRVTPTQGGYLVDVAVFRELEDVARPEFATVGGVGSRHDGTLIRRNTDAQGSAITLGWIPQGRDVTLEQRILADLQARLSLPAA